MHSIRKKSEKEGGWRGEGGKERLLLRVAHGIQDQRYARAQQVRHVQTKNKQTNAEAIRAYMAGTVSLCSSRRLNWSQYREGQQHLPENKTAADCSKLLHCEHLDTLERPGF